MPQIYAVVVTYNGMEWLERCFGSLAGSSLPIKTIAIDNGSTDGTTQFLKKNFPEVTLIETGENLGFGKANNIGIGYALRAGCDYVYLLNQDAWVDTDTIERMVDVHRSNREYFVLSPVQLAGDRTKPDLNFGKCCAERNCPGYLRDAENGKTAPVYEIKFVMAAHWLLSLECLTTVGGFAPIFPHYGEDDNYLHRVRYHGRRAGICPGIYGVHDRENREMTGQHKIGRLYIAFLVRACNINRGGVRAWNSACWDVIKRLPGHMLRFHSLLPAAMFLKGVMAWRRIAAVRRQTKKAEPSYL